MTQVNKRHAVLLVDAVEYTNAVSTAKITSAETDSDFVPFSVAASGGGRDYFLAMTLVQDPAADSLWDLMWSQGGADLEFELWPNGMPEGGIASASQPRFMGTATVKDPDGDVLGGDADPSPSARQVSEVEWQCTEKPLRETSL
jgi:hypothetical protein